MQNTHYSGLCKNNKIVDLSSDSDVFWISNICQTLLFLCSPEYCFFQTDILHTGRVHHRLHLQLFSEFFETYKYHFF
jgi:hypothetical protein